MKEIPPAAEYTETNALAPNTIQITMPVIDAVE